MLELFIKLILAHLIGDFVIQPKKWVDSKEEKKIKSKYLYAHIFVHLIALMVLLQFSSIYLFGMFLIILSHFLIDVFKLYANEKFPNQQRKLFFLDQFLHLSMIFLVIKYYFPESDFFAFVYTPKVLLLLVFLVFSTFAANIIMSVTLSKWQLKTSADGEQMEGSLENAGMYIGILERLFIFCLVVLNQPLGVGLLITAKSVFRYNDLTRAKDRKLTEYVLIGSMLSFGLAILSGITFNYLIKFL
jgi:hypothetical protein